MTVIETLLQGLLIVQPKSFSDSRGEFFEAYRRDRYGEAGIGEDFVQQNVSHSHPRVLRGLHLQNPMAQAKLVSVPEGEIWDVAVDVRVGSPTFGQWHAEVLSGTNHRQLFLPVGFAHGFCVLSEGAVVSYQCSDYYDPSSELTLLWSDPDLGINWPITNPIVSEKDSAGLALSDLESRLPRFAVS